MLDAGCGSEPLVPGIVQGSGYCCESGNRIPDELRMWDLRGSASTEPLQYLPKGS